MSLGAGSSNPLIADTNGDYGITWTSASSSLGIVHNGSYKIFISNTAITISEDIGMGLNKIFFDSDATNTYIAANTDNPEDIEFHADQDLLLMADNAVGVKTLTPAFDLDVNGDIGVNGFIYPEVAQATSLGIQLNASDAEWTTTGYMSQPVVSMTLGTAISATVGRIYNLKGASGWVVADAAGASDSTSLLGLSPKTVSTNTFISEGFMQIPSTDFAGTYADGAPLYLDPSNPGQMTFTAPTTGSGVVVRIVGHAVDSVSANRSTFYIIYFRPSSDWIEL